MAPFSEPKNGYLIIVFFISSCRARSRLGRSSKRLVVGQLFSSCKRTGEMQKARCLPNAETKQPRNTNTKKHTTRRKTPSNQSETLRFQKDEILGTLTVPLHDDIAIPASRKMSQVAHSWKKW